MSRDDAPPRPVRCQGEFACVLYWQWSAMLMRPRQDTRESSRILTREHTKLLVNRCFVEIGPVPQRRECQEVDRIARKRAAPASEHSPQSVDLFPHELIINTIDNP